MARRTALQLAAALTLLVAPVALNGSAQGPADAAAENPVAVRLHSRARVTEALVLLGDVARVEGGPKELRQQIAALDVAELTGRDELTLTAEGIALRVQLAGVEPRQFRVVGATRALVTRAPQELSESALFEAARRAVLGKVPTPAEDVVVRLAQPVAVPGLLFSARDRVRLDAELPAAQRPLGKVVLAVGVHLNDKPCEVVPVALEVLVNQELVVVKRRVEAGETLTPDLLHADRRPVDGSQNYLTPEQARGGLKARRTLLPGQAVTAADVEAPAAEPTALLIKARDPVKLVARVGPLRVTTLGEAIQDGRAGQMIRVRNVDSKSVVSGRVTDRGVVEVDY